MLTEHGTSFEEFLTIFDNNNKEEKYKVIIRFLIRTAYAIMHMVKNNIVHGCISTQNTFMESDHIEYIMDMNTLLGLEQAKKFPKITHVPLADFDEFTKEKVSQDERDNYKKTFIER